MTPTAVRRLATLCVAGTLLSLPASAQTQVIPAETLPSHEADALMAALDVGTFSLQRLELPSDPTGHVFVPVQLGEQSYTVALVPHRMTADEYVLSVDDGSGPQPVESSLPVVWRGTLSELPGSHVAGRLDGGRLDVTISLGAGQPLWGVQPSDDVLASREPGEHVVYRMADLIDRGWSCGGAPGGADVRDEPGDPTGYAGAADDLLCEIAIDADFPFYQSNGSSVANTEADIVDIMNRVETIYMNEVNLQYEITEIVVRTNSADPYSTSSPGGLLNQFAAEWNANQGGVQRDVAHLFTGTNLDGSVIGIAQLSVICSLGSAYGLSQSKFTSNKTSRAGLTAHELGHNWSAQHCDGSSGCAIMCSGLGGCTGNLTLFGPNATNQITNKANQVNCLDDAVPPPPPNLLALSISEAPALNAGAMQVTLSELAIKVKSVEVDGNVIPKGLNGWAVVNDTTISVELPTASQLGPNSVQLFNLGGSSNVLFFDVVETDPPQYTATNVVFTASSDPNAHFTMGGAVGDTAFWIFSIDGLALPYQGYPFLVNAFIIEPIPLNAAGVAELVIPIPQAAQLLTLFSQVAFFDGGLKVITPIASTLVL